MADYTEIPSTDVDADSPVDEDLTGDLNENVKYLFERSVRAGTHATGARKAIATGQVTDTLTTDGSGDNTGVAVVAISFATDSDDGDPNFDIAPRVVVSIEESSASTDWGNPTAMSVWVEEGSVTASGFSARWAVNNGPSSQTIGAHITFIAVGNVTSGE